MIQFLAHREIDKEKWDHCLYSCSYARIYAFSWYLDLVHPQWHALIYGDYEAVFPLPIKNKYGIRYVCRPPFCQQLGLYSENPELGTRLGEFIAAMPSHIRWGHYPLNAHNVANDSLLQNSIKAHSRSNYELSLEASYEDIKKRFKKNTQRNLDKVSHTLIIQDRLPYSHLIELKQANEQSPISSEGYQKLSQVMEKGLDMRKAACWGVWDSSGTQLLAGAYVLKGPNHLVYLLAASSQKGKEERAMFLLIDKLIAQYAGRSLSLDFEGSDIPGLARFYQGFGAQNYPYLQLEIRRLPKWLTAVKSRIFPQK